MRTKPRPFNQKMSTTDIQQSPVETRLTLNIIKPQVQPYCILSWNVDGYSDSIHSWLGYLLTTSRPDVVFISETKKNADTLRGYFDGTHQFSEYNYIINAHTPAQYHGVVALIRKDRTYTQFNVNLNVPARNDTKDGNPVTGRLIAFQLEDQFIIVGTYVPNSGVRGNTLEKLEYRIKTWDPALYALLNTCRASKPTVWLGDINVAPTNIDVSNPKTMCKMAGFTPEECRNFAEFMSSGHWIDVWRSQHPTVQDYSWKGHTPKPNYGMRLDNIIVSTELAPRVNSTFMMPDCILSDHIPVGAYIYKQ